MMIASNERVFGMDEALCGYVQCPQWAGPERTSSKRGRNGPGEVDQIDCAARERLIETGGSSTSSTLSPLRLAEAKFAKFTPQLNARAREVRWNSGDESRVAAVAAVLAAHPAG